MILFDEYMACICDVCVFSRMYDEVLILFDEYVVCICDVCVDECVSMVSACMV